MAKARVKPLSFQERQGIGVMGEELYQYLYNFKRDVYWERQQDGTLLPYLQKMGEQLDDMVIDLMQNGMDEAGAKELARAEFNEDSIRFRDYAPRFWMYIGERLRGSKARRISGRVLGGLCDRI